MQTMMAVWVTGVLIFTLVAGLYGAKDCKSPIFGMCLFTVILGVPAVYSVLWMLLPAFGLAPYARMICP